MSSQIRNISRLNQQELDNNIPISASWHQDFRDTAYIFFGGLPFDITEGDILIIFSQYGVPVHMKLVRDKETGKSRGFGWLKYEDQRSTILAVDNLNGAKILGRMIKVDHAYYEDKDHDEEYEEMLNEELKNDFADKDEVEAEKKTETIQKDDEFTDPLLLMNNKTDDDKRDKERKHRSRDHDKDRHRSRRDSKHRGRDDKHRSRDSREHRSRSHRHRDDYRDRDDRKLVSSPEK